MNSDEIKNYNQVANALNRIRLESSKNNHPSPEDIYLFNLKEISKEGMGTLADHIEHCLKCSEILDDVEFFQEIENEVDAVKLDVSINMPNLDELIKSTEMEGSLKAKLIFGFMTEMPDLLRTAFQSIANLWNEKLIPAPHGGLSSRRLESVNVKFNGRIVELKVYVSISEMEIEIYSADESLSNKVLVIYFGENEELTRGVFETDTTTEGMEVSCSLRVPQNLNTMEQIKSLKLGII